MFIKPYFLTLIITLLLHLSLSAQLTLRLAVLPENTPENADFFVTGSFNGWPEGDSAYQLSADQNGVPSISLDLAAGTYEYKFTRGSWETVEGNAQGGFLPNRSITYNGSAMTVDIIVQSWEGEAMGNSTATPNVSILSESFYMPQLNRNRRIWIYLPPNYESTSTDYPVLYMHDGQNLFDAYNSFSGEWEVDESLNMLFENGDDGIIVIGIDNGGSERINEYTPWPNSQYGGGDGEAYVSFIVETLKPYVDANYRTFTDAQHTGIMGSSLGGLISLYGAIAHQDVFGRAGVFSPSLWFTDDIYEFVGNTGKEQDMKIFLLAGEQEGSAEIDVVADVQQMYNSLLSAGFGEEELFVSTHADGEHSEWYWAREFPDAYEWLFDDITFVENSPSMEQVHIWPIPATDILYFENLPEINGVWETQIIDCQGRIVSRQSLQENHLRLDYLTAGSYFIFITNRAGNWFASVFQKV